MTLDNMTKIYDKFLYCPRCGSANHDLLALSAITGIFMCRDCKESFGLKWLSPADIAKVKTTKEYKALHPEEKDKKRLWFT